MFGRLDQMALRVIIDEYPVLKSTILELTRRIEVLEKLAAPDPLEAIALKHKDAANGRKNASS